MSPESIDSLVGQADALRAIGRYDDAIVLMQRALTIDPEHYGSIVTLGLAQLGDATPKVALDTASRAAALRPEAALKHRIRASAYRSLGRKREALDEANRVVTLEPDFATSHQLLAEMLAISRKRNEAVKAAAHAISLDPESAAAHETLGFALMHAKRRGPEAEAALRTALALDPARSTARFNLGLVLRQQGRAQEAMGITRALVVETPGDFSNVRAMVGHTDAFLREGPVNRAMRTMFRWSVLRFPIILGLMLVPFAAVERRIRRHKLPPAEWEAVRRARRTINAGPRGRRTRLHQVAKVRGRVR